jgi:cytidylate kinase
LPNQPWTSEQSMTIITVSRQLGSHGGEIAANVAQELGLRLIDAEMINRAAEKTGVPRNALAELQTEGEQSLASKVLKALRTKPLLPSTSPRPASPVTETDTGQPRTSATLFPFGGLFSPTVPPISASLEGYLRMVGLVIRGLANEGNVLILGRGGQVLLRNYPGALHVQTVAPLSYRVEAVRSRYGVSKREAQRRVRASDRARSDYLRRYHDVDWLDPTLYHLVVNTATLPTPTIVQLIIDAHKTVQQASKDTEPDKTADAQS